MNTTRTKQIGNHPSGKAPMKVVEKEERGKGSESQKSVGIFSASVIWDACVIIFTDYRESGQRLNSEYCIILSVPLSDEIAKKKKTASNPTNSCSVECCVMQ